MRFARQATIFRGPLDPAPVLGVLFLLVIFVLLDSLVYTPGVVVQFDESSSGAGPIITVTSRGTVLFDGKTNTPAELGPLRERLKNEPGDQAFQLKVESGADPKLVQQVKDLFPVRLADGENLEVAAGPTIIVAVNFRGQCFFENRQVQEAELKGILRRRLEDVSRTSKDLTMVLQADKATENAVVMRLCGLAREVGIKRFLLALKPSAAAVTAGRPRS